MLKFREGILSSIISAMNTAGANIQASPKVTQAVLNTMQKSKEFNRDIAVHSSLEGLILTKHGAVPAKPTVFVEAEMLEFSEKLTADLHHKSNDAKAEFRYYPAFRQMMRVRSRANDTTVLVDDDHNIFRVSSSLAYASAKVGVIPIFFPKLITERKEADTLILASNTARGMDGLKAGDQVTIREYTDMVKEFGKETIPFGYEDDRMDVTCQIKGAETLLYTDHAKYLGGRTMTIASVLDERQEVTFEETQTKLVNPKSGDEVHNTDPIRFSKLHLIKV